VNKAKWALVSAKQNPAQINYEKVDEAWELIQPTLTSPETCNEPEPWKYAGDVLALRMNKMLIERQNTGEMDENAFFENQYYLVTYYSKCDSLEHTPTAKGKPRKIEFHQLNSQAAKGPRTNLLIAGSNLYSTAPDQCIRYLNLYLNTLKDSLFHEFDLEKTDTMVNDAKFIMASAYMEKQDTAKALPYLMESIDSKSYGMNAVFTLAEIYKGKDEAKYIEYLEKGFEKYPKQKAFYKNLFNAYTKDKKVDQAIAVLDKVTKLDPTDDWAYYYKAATYYNANNLVKAKDAFIETTKVNPDYAEAYQGAGTCAWKLAQDSKDKAKQKAYYAEAIQLLKKCQEVAPDQPELWGYALYAVYNNSGDLTNSAKYKKYSK
jgi:tetratricopeptide (TPR) repeat protein